MIINLNKVLMIQKYLQDVSNIIQPHMESVAFMKHS